MPPPIIERGGRAFCAFGPLFNPFSPPPLLLWSWFPHLSNLWSPAAYWRVCIFLFYILVCGFMGMEVFCTLLCFQKKSHIVFLPLRGHSNLSQQTRNHHNTWLFSTHNPFPDPNPLGPLPICRPGQGIKLPVLIFAPPPPPNHDRVCYYSTAGLCNGGGSH